ncbi:MAG: hypothetical protein MK100_09800 [Phycisphaerales bacterium]|nr:hypothetical protein [Phycisphaerales bacterium]
MTNRKPTFKELQEAAKSQMDRNLMARGRQASQIAKIVRGAARRRLYKVKDKALAHLIRYGRAKVRVDRFKCPGLLSVRVRSQGSLHTHAGWLKPHLGHDLRDLPGRGGSK